MRTLNLEQMEKIQAEGCGSSALGLAITFGGAFLVATPIGAVVFAAAFIVGSYNLSQACS